MIKKTIFWILVAGGLSLTGFYSGYAQEETFCSKIILPVRPAIPPKIDGRIDEIIEWKDTANIKDFTALYSGTILAKRQTVGYLLYDDNNLYIAARCYEPEINKIKANVKDKDSNVWSDDCVEIFIDPKDSSATYYHLIVNSSGIIYDSKVDANKKEIVSWDSKAVAVADIKSNCWEVEISIPFKELGLKPTKGAIWGFNLCREETPLKEISSWSPTMYGFNDPQGFGGIFFGSYKEYVDLIIQNLIKEASQIPVPFPSEEKWREEELGKISNEIKCLHENLKLNDWNGLFDRENIIKQKLELLPRDITYKNVKNWEKLFPESKIIKEKAKSYADIFQYAFSFGSEQAALKPGFKQVTRKSLYSPERGYGWKGIDFVNETFQTKGETGPFFERYNSRIYPASLWLDPLIQGNCSSDKENSFLVDLPNGKYCVYFLALYTEGKPDWWAMFDLTMEDGIKDKIELPMAYMRQERLYENVTVKDKQMEIKFIPETTWFINSLIICPQDSLAKMKQVVKKIREEIDSPEDQMKLWKEEKAEPKQPAPLLSAKDIKRGYQIFARNWSDNIYPYTVPRQEEIKEEINIFASPGEYEPATFSVYPLKDLENVKVKISPPMDKEGNTIPEENIDLRVVRYIRARKGCFNARGFYRIVPEILEKKDTIDIDKKEATTYWVTIKVPDKIKAGEFSGKINFSPADVTATAVTLKLKVLPIKLKSNPDRGFGLYLPMDMACMDKTISNKKIVQLRKEERRQEFIDMREHGMTTAECNIGNLIKQEGEKIEIDLELLNDWMNLFTKAGFKGQEPVLLSLPYVGRAPYDLKQELGKIQEDHLKKYLTEPVRLLKAIQEENKWPEFVYYPIDEPAGDIGRLDGQTVTRDVIRIMKAIKAVPGARTYLTVNYSKNDPAHCSFAEAVMPYVDIVSFTGALDYMSTEEILAWKAKKPGQVFWSYPNTTAISHGTANYVRMHHGYKFWSSEVEVLIPFAYYWGSDGNPYNDLDGTMGYMGLVYPNPDGTLSLIPTTRWEAMREGIDDGRYLYTLEMEIKAAKNKKRKSLTLPAEIKNAELLLAEIRERMKEIKCGSYDQVEGFWPGAEYDAYRFKIAREIIRLSEQKGD